VLGIISLPVLGVPRMLGWLAQKVLEEAQQQEPDEGQVRTQLLELQLRYELGEIGDEEYAAQEAIWLQRLDALRRAREQEEGQE